MLMGEPAHFIKNFIHDLDTALSALKPNAKLSLAQKAWLGFCLTGMLLLNNHPLKAGGLERLATESRDTGQIALLCRLTILCFEIIILFHLEPCSVVLILLYAHGLYLLHLTIS